MLLLLPAWVALLAPALPSAPQEVLREPVPAWVEVLELPEPAGGPAAGGVEFLLQDAQDDLRGPEPARFRRLATRVAGAAGVDSESRIEVEFDPEAEVLALHRVAVHRDGATSERLDALDVRVLQREKGLEASMVDGRVTALAFLEDVRVGDVVEVAYSLRGRKAVLGERWYDTFPTAWGVDVRRIHKRVLAGAERALAVRLHSGAPEPERREDGDALELVWDLADVPAVQIEENLPAWYDVLPWAQLSEYADWPEVARWGAELFAPPTEGSPQARALAAELAAASDDPLERTRLALRRVQADVRYLGLVFGEGSHRPSAPDEVLARRFGDCKDKALLLCTLLGELGVEARPALVSTGTLRAVGRQLPSPGAFDHAIVRAVVDGEDLWLDPTQSSERGPIDEWTLPDYGWALVLDAEHGDLVEVVRERGEVPLVRVDKHYALDAAGGSTLEVVTTYSGARANGVREGLEALGGDDLARLCEQYTAEQHAGARLEGTPEVRDDPAANRVVVRERYRLGDLWDGETWATLGCVELAGELIWPVAVQRSQPFALPYPGRYEQHLTAELPGLGPGAPHVTRVADPAFRFESKLSAARDTLTLDASLETLRDHVPAAEVARYADALERVERALYRDVARPGSGGAAAPGDDMRTAGLLGQAAIGLLVAMLAIALVVARSRRDRLRHTDGAPTTPQATYVEGDLLVLPRGAEPPARCARCAGPAEVRRTQRVQWHSAWLYVLLFGGLVYFLVAALLADRDSVRVALCRRHHRARLAARWTAGLAVVVGLVLLIGGSAGSGAAALGGLGLLLFGALAATRAKPAVRARYMDARSVHLAGFGRAYLSAVEASTSVGNVPEERSASSTALRSAA